MATSFSFADLIPEPLTFRDDRFGGDGTIYDVKTRDLIGAMDIARLQRLQATMAEAQRQAGQAPEKAAPVLESAVNEICAMLIPGLPAARLEAIPFAMKIKFLNFWKAQQEEEVEPPAEGGKTAGQA